jgi:pimeloyl-ACP methyl ester carboxylesterase
MGGERMFPAAYLLASNGFEVHRFDPRDHPGASTGTMATFHMTRLVDDVRAVAEAAGGGIVVALSLSSRSVLRALAMRSAIEAAVLLTPVVDVRFTVEQVTGSDWFERIRTDDSPLTRVLGYDVGTVMIRDCVRAGMVDTGDAAEDLVASRAPVTFIAGDADPWVRVDDVRAVVRAGAAAGRDVELTTIPAASHQLYRNPVLAMAFLHAATRRCLELVGRDPSAASLPAFSEIVRAMATDRAELRRAS